MRTRHRRVPTPATRRRLLAPVALAAALGIFPAVAAAGAPNYDCAVGTHARLSIDQWGDVIGTGGFTPGAPLWGTAKDVKQDGASLDLETRLRGVAWHVSVRDGSTVTISKATGSLHGTCAFVPGNYVLRSADAGGSALHAGPLESSPTLLAIPLGTAVWQIPHRAVRAHWFPVLVYTAHEGKIRSVTGWLLQRKPLVVNAQRG